MHYLLSMYALSIYSLLEVSCQKICLKCILLFSFVKLIKLYAPYLFPDNNYINSPVANGSKRCRGCKYTPIYLIYLSEETTFSENDEFLHIS